MPGTKLLVQVQDHRQNSRVGFAVFTRNSLETVVPDPNRIHDIYMTVSLDDSDKDLKALVFDDEGRIVGSMYVVRQGETHAMEPSRHRGEASQGGQITTNS